ncbi:MAG TPA: hypothetical protein VKV26_13620 [Dehalococcoidia bacterium]|nr:hypothetical protein [Dehalococcoidia bacterium]
MKLPIAAVLQEEEAPMKKLLLLTLIVGALAGAFFAFRWFRGETAYEDAVDELDEVETTPAPATA